MMVRVFFNKRGQKESAIDNYDRMSLCAEPSNCLKNDPLNQHPIIHDNNHDYQNLEVLQLVFQLTFHLNPQINLVLFL